MNGIELQDREFIAAIREKREPNASVQQVLPAMRTLGRLEDVLNSSSLTHVAASVHSLHRQTPPGRTTRPDAFWASDPASSRASSPVRATLHLCANTPVMQARHANHCGACCA